MNRKWSLLALVGALFVSHEVIAAPNKNACTSAFVEAQKTRKSGALVRAREALVTCAQNSCPEVVRDKCVEWLPQVEAEIPTVILVAKDANGSDLSDVSVRIDDATESRKIDGQSIPLDPGEHEFEFVLGSEKRTTRVVLAARQKDRLVEAKFEAPAEKPAGRPSDAPTAKAQKKGLPTSVFILGGVGVVALGGFAYFGLTGIQRKNELSDDCGHTCTEDEKSEVDRKLLFADISLGIAVVSLGAATWIAISSSGKSGEVAVRTRPLPGGAQGSVRVSF